VQLLRRARKAELPRRGLEHLELAQRGVLHRGATVPSMMTYANHQKLSVSLMDTAT
jgi:hypothetical protein